MSSLSVTECVATKIVGGCTVRGGEMPWLCGLEVESEMRCGATVLQAGPLATLLVTDQVQVVCAHPQLRGQSLVEGVSHSVTKILSHQDFHPVTFINDIALIFSPAVSESERALVRPACLPSPGSQTDYTGWEMSFVSGWGATRYKGSQDEGPPHKVRHVPQSDSQCREVRGGMKCFS